MADNIFKQYTVEQHVQSLANHMPPGEIWRAKNIQDSNFRKFLNGFGGELMRDHEYLRQFYAEIDPSVTTIYLDEWEAALGIPDDCFPGTGSLEERRLHVVVKLVSLGVQTATDFIELAAMFGVAVEVKGGIDVGSFFPMPFPFSFFTNRKDARFTVVVDFTTPLTALFPLQFPIPFQDGVDSLIECLFRKLIPSNCLLVIRTI